MLIKNRQPFDGINSFPNASIVITQTMNNAAHPYKKFVNQKVLNVDTEKSLRYSKGSKAEY